ncbi:MAG: DUF2764 family protein [Mangrovibacterium sp.]
MAKNYYSLVAGLPDVLLGDRKTAFSVRELLSLLEEELSSSDYQLAKALYYPFDHQNFLNKKYASSADFDERGVYSEEEIEPLLSKRLDDLHEESELPKYMIDVAIELEHHDGISRGEAELKLTQAYYDYLLAFQNDFLSAAVAFERNMKNVFVALNGRKHEVDVNAEFVNDSGEVAEALRKSRARDFGLAGEVERLDEMLKLFEENNLQERAFKIDLLRWDYVEEASFFHYFTIEKVLVFIYKLFLVERWMTLSEDEGKQLFERLLQDLDSKYEFPEEFKLGNGKK